MFDLFSIESNQNELFRSTNERKRTEIDDSWWKKQAHQQIWRCKWAMWYYSRLDEKKDFDKMQQLETLKEKI